MFKTMHFVRLVEDVAERLCFTAPLLPWKQMGEYAYIHIYNKIVIYMFHEMALLMCFLKSEKLHNFIKLGSEFTAPFCCR